MKTVLMDNAVQFYFFLHFNKKMFTKYNKIILPNF